MESITSSPILEIHSNTPENIRKIYNLDLGKMAESVDILEEWIKKQNHFVKKHFSREYLEKIIISCKGSVEKSKKKMDKLCTLKTLLPKFFVDVNIKSDIKRSTELCWFVPLPKMTENYYRILLIKSTNKEFVTSDITQFYRMNISVCDYLMAHDYSNGFIIINDYRGFNLAEATAKLNLFEQQQFVTIMVEGYGVRMKGIHILTESKLIDIFIKTLKPLLSSKIASRLHVHTTVEELYRVVDKKLLPEEYGGEERSLDKLQSEWTKVLTSDDHVKYMSVMNTACTDESCRKTEILNEQYLGLPGTFRTLAVD